MPIDTSIYGPLIRPRSVADYTADIEAQQLRQIAMQEGQRRNALIQMQMEGVQQERAAKAQQQQNALAQQTTRQNALGAMSPSAGPAMPLDPMRLMAMGFSPEEVKQIAEAPTWGRSEVARVESRMGQGGMPERVQLDRFGNLVGNALPQPVKMELANTGGAQTPYNPYAINAPLRMTQSPDSIASNATSRRGQDMTDARTRESNASAVSKPFEVTGPDGPILVRQDKAGNITPVAGFGPKQGASKPMTEGQAKANLFGTRAEKADAVLAQMATKGVDRPGAIKGIAETAGNILGLGTDSFGGALSDVAGKATNWTQSKGQQQVGQAQRDFINAVLRRESGAVINPGEFRNAEEQYFPQVGDSEEVKAQKAANRKTAIEGILAEVPATTRGATQKQRNITVDW